MTNKTPIEQLFKAHYAQMYRLAAALLHNDDLARDIVHDVFIQLLASPSSAPISGGYLLRAVRNRCLNHIRDCNIHERIANRYFLENSDYDTDDWPDEETIARVDSVINDGISTQARRVIELRFDNGLAFSKVAAAMGISESAVYRHLSHALAIIRKKLNENG